MKLKPNEVLLVKGGLGRFHRVTAFFIGPDAVNQANAYLATDPGEAIIAVFAGVIFIAVVDDLGIPILKL